MTRARTVHQFQPVPVTDPLWRQCESHRRLRKPAGLKRVLASQQGRGRRILQVSSLVPSRTNVTTRSRPARFLARIGERFLFTIHVTEMAGTVDVRLVSGGQLLQLVHVDWMAGIKKDVVQLWGCLRMEMKWSWRLVFIPQTGEFVLEGRSWRWFPRREELCSIQHKITNILLCNLRDCYFCTLTQLFTPSSGSIVLV